MLKLSNVLDLHCSTGEGGVDGLRSVSKCSAYESSSENESNGRSSSRGRGARRGRGAVGMSEGIDVSKWKKEESEALCYTYRKNHGPTATLGSSASPGELLFFYG